MRIFNLKLKADLRISIGGEKKDFKKWFQFLAFTLNEYKTYAAYCETEEIRVDDKKFAKFILANLDKFWGKVNKTVNTAKADNEEAEDRLKTEKARMKKLREGVGDCESENDDPSENISLDDSKTDENDDNPGDLSENISLDDKSSEKEPRPKGKKEKKKGWFGN